jgi:hypothetical protein
MKKGKLILVLAIILIAGIIFSVVLCLNSASQTHWDQATFWLLLAGILYSALKSLAE